MDNRIEQLARELYLLERTKDESPANSHASYAIAAWAFEVAEKFYEVADQRKPGDGREE